MLGTPLEAIRVRRTDVESTADLFIIKPLTRQPEEICCGAEDRSSRDPAPSLWQRHFQLRLRPISA